MLKLMHVVSNQSYESSASGMALPHTFPEISVWLVQVLVLEHASRELSFQQGAAS